MKTRFVCGTFAIAMIAVCGEPLLNENFNGTEKLPPTMEGMSRGATLVNAPAEETGRMLELTPKASVMFKAVKVDPKTKYILTFRARSVGPDCMEENPQVKTAFYNVQRANQGLKLPTWELVFTGEDNKRRNSHILYAYHKAILSNQFKTYTDVFYPAPDATQFKIRFENPSLENKLYIDDVKVEPITESAWNINPDFKLGKYDHSGYGQAGYGSSVRMEERPDKQGFYLSVPTWVSGDPMPVEGGRNYVFDAKLVPDPVQSGRIQVVFFDQTMKQLPNCGGEFLVKKADGFGKANFIAPENAAYMRMLIYGGKDTAFEYIRVAQENIKLDK